jgi:hypothetical protein
MAEHLEADAAYDAESGGDQQNIGADVAPARLDEVAVAGAGMDIGTRQTTGESCPHRYKMSRNRPSSAGHDDRGNDYADEDNIVTPSRLPV